MTRRNPETPSENPTVNRDRLTEIWLYSEGYGILPKFVMLDPDLTAEAKVLYAMFASYGGGGDTNYFPTVESILRFLDIGRARYYKHLSYLTNQGYIVAYQDKTEQRFLKNTYAKPAKPAKFAVDRPDRLYREEYRTIREDGLKAVGYGIIPKKVITDPSLPIGAKAVYAYLTVFAGYNDKVASPVFENMLRHLNISRNTCFKYIAQLTDSGYVEKLAPVRDEAGHFSVTSYRLVTEPGTRAAETAAGGGGETPCPNNRTPQPCTNYRTAEPCTEIRTADDDPHPINRTALPCTENPHTQNPNAQNRTAYTTPVDNTSGRKSVFGNGISERCVSSSPSYGILREDREEGQEKPAGEKRNDPASPARPQNPSFKNPDPVEETRASGMIPYDALYDPILRSKCVHALLLWEQVLREKFDTGDSERDRLYFIAYCTFAEALDRLLDPERLPDTNLPSFAKVYDRLGDYCVAHRGGLQTLEMACLEKYEEIARGGSIRKPVEYMTRIVWSILSILI